MPVYILYEGRLLDKRYAPSKPQHAASDLSAPFVQSFSAYPSPIDDRTISSHRQRERDLHSSGSYDPRDTPQASGEPEMADENTPNTPAVTPRHS
jgi:hypothetical protein